MKISLSNDPLLYIYERVEGGYRDKGNGGKGAGDGGKGVGDRGRGDGGVGVGKFWGRVLYKHFCILLILLYFFMYINAITGYQKYLIDILK